MVSLTVEESTTTPGGASNSDARCLLEKLGVTSRTEAVKVANQRGLVRLD